MKKFLMLCSFLLAGVCAGAQDTNVMKELEKPDSLYKSVVTINNTVPVNILPASERNTRAYRIRLYFDNAQDSRTEAYEISDRFAGQFPTVPVDVNYKAPYFMVTAGLYLSHVEAAAFLAKLQDSFKNPFIIPVEVPVSTFRRDIVVNRIDTLLQDSLLLFEIENFEPDSLPEL